MKKVFLAAILLASSCLFASSVDLKGGYSRMEGGFNGLNLAPAMFYNLYSSEGVIKSVDLGGAMDFTMAKPAGWGVNLFIGPEGKLTLPYSYVKFALGYNYNRTAGVNSNDLAMRQGIGVFYPVEGVKVGLDFTVTEIVTNNNFWMISIGPMVSFDF